MTTRSIDLTFSRVVQCMRTHRTHAMTKKMNLLEMKRAGKKMNFLKKTHAENMDLVYKTKTYAATKMTLL